MKKDIDFKQIEKNVLTRLGSVTEENPHYHMFSGLIDVMAIASTIAVQEYHKIQVESVDES